MKLSLRRGRIFVNLTDHPAWMAESLALRAQAAIGSFSRKDSEPFFTVAYSYQNLRKLKEVGRCSVEDDTLREWMADTRQRLDAYKADTQAIARTKGTVLIANGFVPKTPLWQHQREALNCLMASEHGLGLLAQPGTGKTGMVLSFADYLIHHKGLPWKFFVLCPINLIDHVWVAETPKFSHLTCQSLRPVFKKSNHRRKGETAEQAKERNLQDHQERLDELFAKDYDIGVINYESLLSEPLIRRLQATLKRLRKEGWNLCLALDESSKVKSHTGKTFRAIRGLRALCQKSIIMTGTPAPNGVLDMWSQFYLLDQGMSLGASFVDFRHENTTSFSLGNNENAFVRHVEKPGAIEAVYNLVKDGIVRYRTDECIDLPDQSFLPIEVPLTDKQQAHEGELLESLWTHINDQEVTVKSIGVKVNKLRQISGGFLTDDAKNVHWIEDPPPKVLALDELVEEVLGDDSRFFGDVPNKMIIWAQYRAELNLILSRYAKAYGAVGLFGGIGKPQSDKSIRRFKTDPKTRILVCHPASAGHGLTLTEANYAAYYSVDHNYDNFSQSLRRIARAGQTRKTTFYFLLSGDTDWQVLRALRHKENVADMLADGRLSPEGWKAVHDKELSFAF